MTLNGSQMAFVEARMTMLGRDYHDLLTLVHEGTEWKVVTKVFSYTTGAE
ncbi:MAG: nuclear transport factor 2 family protein [Pseudomonadota bacterium]